MPEFHVRLPAVPGASLGFIGGLWGLIAALGLTAQRIWLGAAYGDPFPWGLASDLVLGGLVLVPFGLALAASRWGGPAQRSTAWATAALVAAVTPYAVFSVFSFVFWPVVPILLIAAVRTVWGQAARNAVTAAALALLLLVLNGGAIYALSLHTGAICWDLIRETNGVEHWQSAPYMDPGVIDASGFGVVQIRCNLDANSSEGMLLSAGLLALTVGAWWIGGRAPVALQRAEGT